MSEAVPAIVAAGTHVSHGTHWAVGAAWADDDVVPLAMNGKTTSTQQSDLARMLDLPEPDPPTPFVAGCLAIIIVMGGLVLAAIAAMFALVGRTLTTVDPTLTTSDTTGAVLLAVLTFVFVMGPAVTVAWLLLKWRRSVRDRWEMAHAEWELAAPVAARLVYCRRDYIVYDPANASCCVEPAQTRSYAYQRGATERLRQ